MKRGRKEAREGTCGESGELFEREGRLSEPPQGMKTEGGPPPRERGFGRREVKQGQAFP